MLPSLYNILPWYVGVDFWAYKYVGWQSSYFGWAKIRTVAWACQDEKLYGSKPNESLGKKEYEELINSMTQKKC